MKYHNNKLAGRKRSMNKQAVKTAERGKRMREFQYDGSLVLGVDHGFGNIKTANKVFSNGIITSDTEPLFSSDYLEYEGKYHILNEGYKPYETDKIKDDDYYILTLAAIGKELNHRGMTEAKIHLAVGLPLKWVGNQKAEFKKYLLREDEVHFRYQKKEYHVKITGCTVMPQCYSAVTEQLKDYKGLHLLADIGNGTMNVMYLMDGKGQEKKYWTEVMGVKQCALKIHDAILDKFGEELPEHLLNNYLMTGTADVSLEYSKVMEHCAREYVKEIFRKLKECGYNSNLMKLHFMGGGAKLVELFGEYERERASFNHDICANAKGYEYFCYMALRKNGRKAV